MKGWLKNDSIRAEKRNGLKEYSRRVTKSRREGVYTNYSFSRIGGKTLRGGGSEPASEKFLRTTLVAKKAERGESQLERRTRTKATRGGKHILNSLGDTAQRPQ